MKGKITLAGRKPVRIVATLSFFLSVLLFASCSKEDSVQPAGSTTMTDANNSARAGIPEPVPGDRTGPNVLMPYDAMIYIKHGACLGTCPAYSVALMPDGRVVYTGYRNAGTLGIVKFTVKREIAYELVNAMIQSGFLQLENFYPAGSADDAMNITGLRIGVGNDSPDNPKVVVDYGKHVPFALTEMRARIEMELGIDKLARTETFLPEIPIPVISGQ